MRKLFTLVVSLLMVSGLYAQNAKSVGLADSDVKNWAKNCVSIQKEFEKIGINSDESIRVAAKEKQNAETILQKNGISNPNSIEKYSVILQCAAVLKAESEIDEQSKAMMKMLNVDPLGDLKKNINSKDYAVVASNSKSVLHAIDELDKLDSSSSNSKTASADEDYSDLSKIMSALGGGYSDYESKEERAKKEVLKNYDTKKKFKVVKSSDGEEWIIIQPSEITFKNSQEAEIYAENYTGVQGNWSFCSSCGYLGGTSNKNSKPFYTWVSGGVGCYLTFPIDFDSCAPDKIIEDADVTPEIARKAVLQMYKLNEE